MVAKVLGDRKSERYLALFASEAIFQVPTTHNDIGYPFFCPHAELPFCTRLIVILPMGSPQSGG